ncbi:MAG: hypothetical protein WCO55_02765 [Candidatus Falkowbacteria bacterium]
MKQAKKLPLFLKPYFWSYDFSQIDLEKNRRLIVVNLLNYGSKRATDWLLMTYGRVTVKRLFVAMPQSELSRKSLNYWSIIFGIKPKAKARLIR